MAALVAGSLVGMVGLVGTAGTARAAGPFGPSPGAGARPQVVGGQDTQPGQFPWMVRLSMGCGGAVVTARVVLTAAHCVSHTGSDAGIEATIGRTRLSEPGGQTIRSDYVLRSPRYGQTGTVDWALIELAQPTSAPPLGLVSQGDLSGEADPLTIMGWGATTEGGPQSDALQFGTVPFVDDATCARSYRNQFRPQTEMCAGYPQGGVDSCQGDSGGPMVAAVGGRTVQVGIVSYGMGCARPGYPGVYAEVQSFSAEIASHLGPGGGLVA
ncbi:MAG TPA: serine protease [Mycobacteriales bacterium]